MAIRDSKSPNTYWYQSGVTREDRENMNRHRGIIVWFTGLSASGKSTIAHAVEKELHDKGVRTIVLDGDNVRYGLCGDLGFTDCDRSENLRRIGHVAKLFLEAGVVVLTAFISPFEEDRSRAQRMLDRPEDWLEVYCSCPIEVCVSRDQKGLYRRALNGEIPYFTGVNSPYEPPQNPDVTVDTSKLSVSESVKRIIEAFEKRAFFF
ncbi:MAG: adenylyl-sulfate kinase [Gammaproteobacteria bacterium]|nr:adenylyl-sulfate kinase [Gammaproteobacteria bacterium]